MLHINNLGELKRLKALLSGMGSERTKFPVDVFVTPGKLAAFDYAEDNKALLSYEWEDGEFSVESSESSGGNKSMREFFWESENETLRLSRMCHHDNIETPA